MTASLTFTSLSEYGFERCADLLTRAFQDYFVKLSFTADGLFQSARCDGVDLVASRIVLSADVAVGIALIARRGWTSRLAGMALLPEARRHGVGRALVTRVLEEARLRGERTMMLEVIEQNEPAVKLYERCGFERIRRLVGFSGTGDGDAIAAKAVHEVDLRTVGAAISAHAAPDLPWQLSGETIGHLTPPGVGYHLNGAWIAVSDVRESLVAIRGLVAERGVDEQLRAATLLRAVIAKHPEKTWKMTAVWPEEASAVFSAAKLARTPLSQWQMKRELR